jgi:radical SAM superfamily enzyme YgiQ (UPF0313 family)
LDILLINPPWLTKDGTIWHGVQSTSPPLGLLHVAAYAEQQGRAVHVLDANAEQLGLEDIGRVIRRHRPAWVGLTAVTAQIGPAHRVAEIVKKAAPDSKVVIGGAHATALPDEVLQDLHVDYVIRGEGELSFLALVDGQPRDGIGGLTYRGDRPGSPVCHNPEDEPISDLDALPPPAYHLIRFDRYKPAVGAYRRLPALAMTVTRGCPGKCTFCSSAQTPLRTHSAERIVDQLEQLQRRYGIREVSFYDDTFTVFKKNVSRLCDLMVARRLDLTWSCFARTDCVSASLLAKMKLAGCHQILFGIESADPRILENIRKPIDIGRTQRAVRLVREAGIEVRAAFMFGNPGETVESLHRTIAFAKRLDPDIAVFNMTTPYPGTQMFDWAKRHGYLRTLDWNDYDLANAVMELPTISSVQLNRLYKVAYRSFYLRPSYLLRRLLRLRSPADVKVSVQALRSILSVRGTAPRRTGRQSLRDSRDVRSWAPSTNPGAVEVCT